MPLERFANWKWKTAALRGTEDRSIVQTLSSFLIRFAGFCLTAGMIGSILILTSRAPMAPLVPVAEERLSQFAGGRISIDGLTLLSTSSSVELRFDTLYGEGAQPFAARDGKIELTLGRLLNLRPIPRRIEIATVSATVVGGTESSDAPTELPIEQLLAALSSGETGDLSLPAVTISYETPRGEELFRLDDGKFDASMRANGYGIEAKLPFRLADGSIVSADLEIGIEEDGSASLAFLSDGAPVQPLLTAFGVDAFSLESNITGAIHLFVDGTGQPKGGSFDVEVGAGAGTIGGRDFELGRNKLVAKFDDGKPVFRIDELFYNVAGNRGTLMGEVGAENLLDPVNLLLDFDVSGRDISVDLKEFMDGPINIASMRAAGRFDAADRDLFLQELRSEFFGSELKGSLGLTFPEGFSGSPRIVSSAVLPGPLTPQQVLAGWPRPLAREARNWVIENLLDGQLTDLSYESDIPMGAIREGQGLNDETMLFTFKAADARLLFLPDMPAITQLSASAVVRGNSFFVDGDQGYVQGVRITDARFAMPKFKPAGEEASFTGRLQGELSTVLKALESSNLVDFSEGAYTSDSFHGEGSFDLRVSWPLQEVIPEDRIYIGGQGAFVRGGLDDVVPGIDATDAGGQVVLSPQRIVVRGSGLAAQAPTDFEWSQSLVGAQKAQLTVTTDLDTLAADMIGVPLREFFRGQVKTQIFADDLRPGAPLNIIGELTDAAVSIPLLGVRKPRGIEGFFETSVALPEAEVAGSLPENIVLNELRLGSPSFNIEGSGTFTPEGAVVRLELPRLFIEDTADLSLRLLTSEEGIDLDIDGEYASAITAIDGFFASEGPGKGELPGEADVDVALDRLALKNEVFVHEVAASGHHNGTDVESFTFTGRLGDEGAVSITVDKPDGSELGFVEVESTDFGALMNGVFGVSSVSGAAGSIKGTTLPDDTFDGRFEMGELIIRDAPVLARILSFTSLDGLADALAGEGIRFTRLEGDVLANGSLIELSDAKLVGSSLGISASGSVDLEGGTVDIRGAFAPVFALNGFLGSIPGVGRLFVSREGEGIVAFSYTISGSLEQPTITVNALSALTPGILRRLFDPVSDGPETLDRATGEAERQRTLPETP